jgi:predicted transcriptional regulator
MTAYKNTAKSKQTVCTLKAIREQLKWSFAEMAESLKLSRSTYQCYDEGTRATPPDVLLLAQETLKKSLQHSVEIKKRYRPGGPAEKEINRQYPKGIMSEVSG